MVNLCSFFISQCPCSSFHCRNIMWEMLKVPTCWRDRSEFLIYYNWTLVNLPKLKLYWVNLKQRLLGCEIVNKWIILKFMRSLFNAISSCICKNEELWSRPPFTDPLSPLKPQTGRLSASFCQSRGPQGQPLTKQ